MNLTGGKWLGLPEPPLDQVPRKPGNTLTSPHQTVLSQHPAQPQGSLRDSEEHGQRTGGPHETGLCPLPCVCVPHPDQCSQRSHSKFSSYRSSEEGIGGAAPPQPPPLDPLQFPRNSLKWEQLPFQEPTSKCLTRVGGALTVELRTRCQVGQGRITPFKFRTLACAIRLHTSEAPSTPPPRPTSAGTEASGLCATRSTFILESKTPNSKASGCGRSSC